MRGSRGTARWCSCLNPTRMHKASVGSCIWCMERGKRRKKYGSSEGDAGGSSERGLRLTAADALQQRPLQHSTLVGPSHPSRPGPREIEGGGVMGEGEKSRAGGRCKDGGKGREQGHVSESLKRDFQLAGGARTGDLWVPLPTPLQSWTKTPHRKAGISKRDLNF